MMKKGMRITGRGENKEIFRRRRKEKESEEE